MVDAAKEKAEGGSGNGRRSRRPCYDRDHTWLRWLEEEGMRPAAIRDRWNRDFPHKKIGSGNSGRKTVKKGLDRARAEQKPT
jgi:hypothetical protein